VFVEKKNFPFTVDCDASKNFALNIKSVKCYLMHQVWYLNQKSTL